MKILLATALTVAMYYGSVQQGHGAKGRIGILYDPVHHRVVKVYGNTPAEEAGIMPGDIILHVNDKDITGPSYTKVNLTIKRGKRVITFEIERIPRELVDESKYNEVHPEKELDQTIEPELSNRLSSRSDDRIT